MAQRRVGTGTAPRLVDLASSVSCPEIDHQLVGAMGFEGVGQIVSGWPGAVTGPCGSGGAVFQLLAAYFQLLAAYAVPVMATRMGRRLGRPRRVPRRRRREGPVSVRRHAGCAEVLERADGRPFGAR